MTVSNPTFRTLFPLLGPAACTGVQPLKGTSANACLLTESLWVKSSEDSAVLDPPAKGTTL